MRATSGTWLHAQLTVLVAACWATGCGGTTHDSDEQTPGAGAAAGGSGSMAQAGQAAHAGSVGQAGSAALGGSDSQAGSAAQGGQVAQGGAAHGGAPGLVCNGSAPKLTDSWHTDPAVDYVAQLWRSDDVAMVNEESGERCSGASSKADCETAYAALVPSQYWVRGVPLAFQEWFTYTRGDDVGAIGGVEQLRQVLGSLDTPNEAAVWLYANGRAVNCDGLETLPDGYLGHIQKELSDCPISYQPTDVKVTPNGTMTETVVGEVVVTNLCAGRRPDGLQIAAGARTNSQLGDCFAQMAELELASIAAFTALERQLAAHGAPEQLLQRCRSARSDELGHARSVAALARRFGAQPKSVRVAPQGLPTLRQLALENVREGCVRELYGAAVATWQSAHAQDAQIRAVFSGIARDESEHAALALDVAAWLDAHLNEAERAEVEAERQRAVEQLRAELLVGPGAEAEGIAGLPSATQATALLTALTTFAAGNGRRT